MSDDALMFCVPGQVVFAFNDESDSRYCRCRNGEYWISDISGYGTITGDFAEWIRTKDGQAECITPFPRKPGEYHPRIWRPGNCPSQVLAGGESAIRQSAVAAEIIVDKLRTVCETIEPHPENYATFGHEIRNVLLLACMEVESALASILRANGYPSDRWNSNDYVKLNDVLGLPTFRIRMNLFPDFPVFSPFAAWRPEQPTQSLPWYDA